MESCGGLNARQGDNFCTIAAFHAFFQPGAVSKATGWQNCQSGEQSMHETIPKALVTSIFAETSLTVLPLRLGHTVYELLLTELECDTGRADGRFDRGPRARGFCAASVAYG